LKLLSVLVILLSIINLCADPVIHYPPSQNIINQFRGICREAPGGDEIINPAEFGRTDGVFMAWAGWDTQLIADIAYHVSQQYNVYMIVADEYAETEVYDFFHGQDVNLENVIFLYDSNVSNSSMWIRDYAPFFIKEDGAQAVDDF
jgi:agmatine/peptidylarginine deiminase